MRGGCSALRFSYAKCASTHIGAPPHKSIAPWQEISDLNIGAINHTFLLCKRLRLCQSWDISASITKIAKMRYAEGFLRQKFGIYLRGYTYKPCNLNTEKRKKISSSLCCQILLHFGKSQARPALVLILIFSHPHFPSLTKSPRENNKEE